MVRNGKLGQRLTAIAAVLALLAGVYLVFSTVEVHSITASSTTGDPATVEETTSRLRWYQVQGWWGVTVLVLVSSLYGGAYYLARRGKVVQLGFLSIFALLLVYFSGFSIGLFYLPAALVLFIGTGILFLSRFWESPGRG